MSSIRQHRVVTDLLVTISALAFFLCHAGCQGGGGSSRPNSSFYPLPAAPSGVAVSTLDGNSTPDVAVIAKYQGLYLFLNVHGGLDMAPVLRQYLPYGLAIDAGDFNRDGIQDLAYIVENNIQLLINDGSGTNYQSDLVLDGPLFSQFVKAADLNNDGITDLVAVGTSSNEVYIHLSSAPLRYTLTKVTLADRSLLLPFSAKTLDIGDINGDGFLDLIIPEFSNNALWIVVNNEGRSFTPRLAFTMPPEDKIMHASFLFYDKDRGASFIALAAGSYNPVLIVLSCDGSGTCLTHESITLPYKNPLHSARVIRDNIVTGLLITHYRVVQVQGALSYVRLNTTAPSLSIIASAEPLVVLPSHCVMSIYQDTIGALTACQNPDGIVRTTLTH